MGRKMKTSHASLCSDCFYPNRWTKRGLFDLQWRKENTRNPQAMSLQPHVTKKPHLVGKLAIPQSKQTPTRPKRTDRSPQESAQGTASAAPLKRSSVWRLTRFYLVPVASRLLDVCACKATPAPPEELNLEQETDPLLNRLHTISISPVTCCTSQLESQKESFSTFSEFFCEC